MALHYRIILGLFCALAVTIGVNLARGYSNHVVLQSPTLHVGDWFELETTFRIDRRSSKSDMDRWHGYRSRYKVLREERILGYDCIVLSCISTKVMYPDGTWHPVHRGESEYFFRIDDMNMIACIPKAPNTLGYFGLPPWPGTQCREFGVVPRFPVKQGNNRYAVMEKEFLQRQPSELILPVAETGQAYLQSAKVEDIGRSKYVRIQVENFVCKWRIGDIWWAQCWNNNIDGSVWRSVLINSSKSGMTYYSMPLINSNNVVIE